MADASNMLRSSCDRIRLDGIIGPVSFRSGGDVKAGVVGAGIGLSDGDFNLLGVKDGSLRFAAYPGSFSPVVLGMSTVHSQKTKVPALRSNPWTEEFQIQSNSKKHHINLQRIL